MLVDVLKIETRLGHCIPAARKRFTKEKLWLLVLAGLFAGCSHDSLETARNQKRENADHWKVRETKMEGQPDDIVFTIKAQNGVDTPEGETVAGLAIGCGGFGSNALVTLGGKTVENGNLKIGFDGTAPVSQTWQESQSKHSLRVPDDLEDDFLFRLTKAKTFEVEITPKGGKPQRSTFELRNIKELMSLETSCESWLAAAHVSPS